MFKAMDGNTVHFIAGAVGGTAGAVLTCPLEVLKTRLQSSKKFLFTNHALAFREIPHNAEHRNYFRSPFISSLSTRVRMSEIVNRIFITSGGSTFLANSTDYATFLKPRLGILACLRNIISNEGLRALFKGLVPNLVGVAPSRAIYFAAYAQGKTQLNSSDLFNPDTPIIHLFAAAFAGFSSATCTNPIWVIKTRMQLNQNSVTTYHCARNIYAEGGVKSFYKGVTASYYGLTETIIHLVIYEEIKRFLVSSRSFNDPITIDEKPNEFMEKEELKITIKTVSYMRWFLEYMGAGAISKTIATVIAYPHEVARTRLREENSKYYRFWQTLFQVYKDEGFRGIYRGLCVQLVRQIPNTAVVMATYEAMVYLLSGNPSSQVVTDQEYD